MRQGIIGLNFGCGREGCPDCGGSSWFIMGLNPFETVDAPHGMEAPGNVGETVNYDVVEGKLVIEPPTQTV